MRLQRYDNYVSKYATSPFFNTKLQQLISMWIIKLIKQFNMLASGMVIQGPTIWETSLEGLWERK